MRDCPNKNWGGRRDNAGRKRTCTKKVSFNRRINENILNILREFAQSHNMTETDSETRLHLPISALPNQPYPDNPYS